MKKWIIKKNRRQEFIRLERFGIFNKSNPIKLHRKYYIESFNPITLFRNIIQEIKIKGFWCKFLYRLDNKKDIEFVIEDCVNDKIELIKVFSTYIGFVDSIEFGVEIYLNSRNELCRKYIVNGTTIFPICTNCSSTIGSFYKILGPKLSVKRETNLLIEYEDC